VQQELTRGEHDAYNEAIEAIEGELEALEHVKQSVKGLLEDPVIFTIPGGPNADGIIEIPNTPVDQWRICSSLLKFHNSQVFLCDRKLHGQTKEFAVIEQFNRESPYANAVGEAEVLLAGDDPVLLVQEYAARAEHSLQFMASNLVSKAHRIVWARYASTSPARVVSVISARCAEAASLNAAEQHAEHTRSVQPSREHVSGNRIARPPV
jgi:hypothetical protein